MGPTGAYGPYHLVPMYQRTNDRDRMLKPAEPAITAPAGTTTCERRERVCASGAVLSVQADGLLPAHQPRGDEDAGRTWLRRRSMGL